MQRLHHRVPLIKHIVFVILLLLILVLIVLFLPRGLWDPRRFRRWLGGAR